MAVSFWSSSATTASTRLVDCFALLRRAADVPAQEIVRLVDAVALSFLVGNHDAHGKNHSLLYLPSSPGALLAPAYDVLSTIAYDKVRARQLDRMLDEAGLGVAVARRRLRGLATAAPIAVRAAHAELATEGWDAPVLARIVMVVEQRAKRLERIAAVGMKR